MTDPHEESVPSVIEKKPNEALNSNNEAYKKSKAEEQTLTGLPLVLVLVAIVSATFLVALVIKPPFKFPNKTKSFSRIEQLLQRPHPRSRINSTH